MAVAGAGVWRRLARWRGWTTWPEPLVVILHLGYGWLGCGLLLVGFAGLFPASIGQLATLHALTVGAVGTMTLAIMTRATLGHPGRALTADRATCWIYGLVQAGAVMRVAAPVLPLDYQSVLLARGLTVGGGFSALCPALRAAAAGPAVGGGAWCRYLCPLGAALALPARLRQFE